MEMPDVIYAWECWNNGEVVHRAWNINDVQNCKVTYHHSRIVETLRRENEELKAAVNILEQKLRDVNKAHDRAEAKLDKAMDALRFYSGGGSDYWDAGHRARTTLEEIK